MQKSDSTTGPCGQMRAGLTKNRREAGTSLVEILVVIVIFLIGILAVVQIFPRGFALLLTTRNNSAATALGRDMVERLKANPDLIPDEVVPVRYSGGTPVVDTTINPLALGPQGDTLSAAGILSNGGTQVTTDWLLASGPNVARRIVGEGHRLPAARELGAIGSGAAQYENYGGVLLLDHGPIGIKSPLVAYANDLSRNLGAPVGSSDPSDTLNSPPVTSASGGTPVQQVYADGSTSNINDQDATMVSTPATTAPYEYFVVNPDSPDAAVYLPANHAVARTYRIRMSAYVGSGAGYQRYDYLSLSVRVPATPNVAFPLVRVRLADLLTKTKEVQSGLSMANVEPESVRVAPQYVRVTTWTTASSLGLSSATPYAPVDPFEMKVIDANLGVLLFSPAARNGVVERAGGTSEPLIARVDYDVRDWRILNEDFRVVNNNATFQLSLQSLKVGSSAGPDGLANGGLFTVSRTLATDNYPIDPSPSPRDNVVVIDETTGFEVQRYRTSDQVGGRTMADSLNSASVGSDVLVSVDKSRGSVTLNDARVGNTNAAGVDPVDVVLIPPTGSPITVDANNRTFRVLYRARQEWSVQLFKAASQYSVLNAAPSPASFGADQCFLGSDNIHLYFPPSETGHKVTIDRIVYSIGGTPQILEGQDFVLRIGGNDASGYAYADLSEALGNNARFAYDYGVAVQGVKGASLSVRVLWNPEAFSLGTDSPTNMDRADKWARGWRKSTTETYLRAEETR